MHVYSIQRVYDKLKGEKETIIRDKVIWNKLSNPNHKFIAWLAIQAKLQTIEKLARIGISSSNQCSMCDVAVETHTHLFFQCTFSTRCLQEI